MPPQDANPTPSFGGFGLNQMNSGVYCIPALLREEGLGINEGELKSRPNLSIAAQTYLDALGKSETDLFYHVLAVLHRPAYQEANAGALRTEGPHIPLPGWPEGESPAATVELAASAELGRELAQLLDSDTPVPGVTTGHPSSGDRHHRGTRYRRWPQHVWRRLFSDGGLGTLWDG